MTHEIKILPEHYDKLRAGVKTFEVRKDDRGYSVGDTLLLREWSHNLYTGRIAECKISDIYRGEFCREGYCIISFHLTFPAEVPRIPVPVFMELYSLYLASVRAVERMEKEKTGGDNHA